MQCIRIGELAGVLESCKVGLAVVTTNILASTDEVEAQITCIAELLVYSKSVRKITIVLAGSAVLVLNRTCNTGRVVQIKPCTYTLSEDWG